MPETRKKPSATPKPEPPAERQAGCVPRRKRPVLLGVAAVLLATWLLTLAWLALRG